MKKLVIFGTSQIAEVIAFYFEQDSDYDVMGYTVDAAFIDTDTFQDRPVVPFEDVTTHFRPEDHDLFVAVSYQSMNKVRAAKYAEAKSKGYALASYISSKATTWPDLKVGDNTFIMEDNTVQPFAKIGNNTIVWSGNHIGHHSSIANHCFVSSHVVISGNVHISDRCFLGVNATLRNNITLGEATLVGAGATVLSDTEKGAVYTGEKAALKTVKSDDLREI